MLTIKIPGRNEMTLSHLILDYNGTIAEDGNIIEEIVPRLEELSQLLEISVIGKEGCCGALISHVDVVVTSIADALDLLIQTDRLRATLRT